MDNETRIFKQQVERGLTILRSLNDLEEDTEYGKFHVRIFEKQKFYDENKLEILETKVLNWATETEICLNTMGIIIDNDNPFHIENNIISMIDKRGALASYIRIGIQYLNEQIDLANKKKLSEDEKITEILEKYTSTDEDIDEIFDSPVKTVIGMGESIFTFDISTLPKEFNSQEAKQLKQKLVNANLLTDNWKPNKLSITERGYLADEIASRLQIKAKWKVLGKLWNDNPETLRQGKNKAMSQSKTSAFIEKLKEVLN